MFLPLTTSLKYNVYGVLAILCWSAFLASARITMEQLGPNTGAALLYSLATLFLAKIFGFPALSRLRKNYLFGAGAMFVSYEIILALSMGYADSRLQAVQVSIVNYLWPALTVWLATLRHPKQPSRLLYLGLLMAFCGVVLTLINRLDQGLLSFLDNLQSNPLVFAMMFIGALIWAGYCNFTKKHADQPNLISYFFLFTAIGLWVKTGFSDESAVRLSMLANPMVLISSLLVAAGYGLWNVAIVRGNFMLLASLSYFTPITSALLSSILLATQLPAQFWPGVALVTLGSLICWRVTRSH